MKATHTFTVSHFQVRAGTNLLDVGNQTNTYNKNRVNIVNNNDCLMELWLQKWLVGFCIRIHEAVHEIHTCSAYLLYVFGSKEEVVQFDDLYSVDTLKYIKAVSRSYLFDTWFILFIAHPTFHYGIII